MEGMAGWNQWWYFQIAWDAEMLCGHFRQRESSVLAPLSLPAVGQVFNLGDYLPQTRGVGTCYDVDGDGCHFSSHRFSPPPSDARGAIERPPNAG